MYFNKSDKSFRKTILILKKSLIKRGGCTFLVFFLFLVGALLLIGVVLEACKGQNKSTVK